MSAPIRHRIEPGIFERVDAEGRRLGLEVAFKDATGAKRRRTVQGGIREARDELAKARTRRSGRQHEPTDPRMTLAAVIALYRDAHAGQRANTRSARESALARIEATFGNTRITAIRRADVRKLVSAEVAEGLKANTVRLHYSTLRALFTFAREDLEVPVTFPRLKSSDLPDPGEDQRQHRILDDDGLARVLDAAPTRAALFFRLLAETGCRASEGLGLAPGCVGDGTVTFERQLARDGTLAPLKTRQSRRTVEVTRGLSAQLRLAGDGERVFTTLGSVRQAGHQWAAALKRAGLDGARPVVHDLRHTHASKLIAAGWDVVEVAKRLGDRTETVLGVYAGEFDARRRSEGRRAELERLYGQTPKLRAVE